MKRIALIIVSLLMLLCIASCDSSAPVSVNLNGGSMDLNVTEDTKLETVAQTKPTKDGYVFAGWYSDATFTDYIYPTSVSKAQRKLGTAYAKWIDIPKTTTYDVRRDETSITDSGRDKQQLDRVRLSEDYNISDLQRAGYTSLKIKLTALISEVDDGYQYIFFYKNEKCNSSDLDSILDVYDKYVFDKDDSDPNLIHGQRFDHGGSGADSSWKLVTVEANIPLSSLSYDLYIRYGASGKGDDTWRNKEITVTVTPVGGPLKDDGTNNGGTTDDSQTGNGNTDGEGTTDTALEEFLSLISTKPTKEGYIFVGWYSDERFTDYIDPYYVLPAQKEAKTAYAKWIPEKLSVSYTVRDGETLVTDSGRKNQKLDTVKIGSDFHLDDLRLAGYTKLHITVTLQTKEKDDGYQYIFLYTTPSSYDNTGLIGQESHDCTTSSWETFSFTKTVYIDDLPSDMIYLRYGADGSGDDDWYNKNVRITFTVAK